MTWTSDDVQTHRQLAYLPARGWEDYKRARDAGRHPLMSYSNAQYDAFLAGVNWLLKLQNQWDGIDASDAIWELRAGTSSMFYPLFRDEPAFWADCPHCDMRTLTTANGCTECGYDHQSTKGTH